MFRRQFGLGVFAGTALTASPFVSAGRAWAQSPEPIRMGITFDAAKQAS